MTAETFFFRRGLAASTLVVALLMLLSSMMGYVREGGLAAIFGASGETDAYLVAFFIPNSLFLVLISGSLSQVFVPIFVEYLSKGQREEAWVVASSVFNLLTPVLLALAGLAVLGSPLIVLALAPGLDPEAAALAERLTRVMMPLVLFLGLSAVVSALLNSLGEFTVPALSPLVGTSVVLVSLLTLGRWMGIEGVALGTLAGAAAQLVVQVPALVSKGFRYRWCFDFHHPGVQRIIALCLPLLAYVALSHVALYVERAVASGLETGSISVLNYAMRVFMMPLAIPMAVSTVLFPTFAGLAAVDDRDRLGQRVTQAARTTILLLAPVSMFFIVAGLPLVRLLFERGRFGDSDASVTALVLAGYSLGLVPTAVAQVFLRALYSLRDVVTPIVAEAASLLFYVPTSIGLAHVFEAPGLATARALSFYLMALVVFLRLQRKIDLWSGWRGWWHAARPLVAAAGAGLTVGLVLVPLADEAIHPATLALKASTVVVLGLAGLGLYAAACGLMGVRTLAIRQVVPTSGGIAALRLVASQSGGRPPSGDGRNSLAAERGWWRRHWLTYGDRSGERDIWWALDRAKFERLKGSLPPVGRSLEVGCGSARLSALVGTEGYRVVGLDYCAEAASLARRSFSRGGVSGDAVMGEAQRLPFCDASFDIVLSTGLLEHFEDPSPIVQEMVRVLRPGGVFYSDVVPHKFSLMRALDGLRGGNDHQEEVAEHPFSGAELRALLSQAGLQAVRVFPAGVFPPRLPILGRLRAVREAQGVFCFVTRRLWGALDGTPLAERMGLYYFCLGWKDGSLPQTKGERDGSSPRKAD